MKKFILLFLVSVASHAQYSPKIVPDEEVFGITEIITADLDNNGYKEIITSQKYFNNHKVSFFNNLGDGSFGSQQIVSTNLDTPLAVAAGDINSDGWVDILSISRVQNTAIYYLNEQGSFPDEVIFDDSFFNPMDIKTDDIDNDGDDDIVVIDRISLNIYYNQGNLNFTKQTIDPGVITEYTDLIITDINNDGFKDIVTGSLLKTLIYINSQGQFSFDEARTNSIGNEGFITVTHMADFNNDGNIDLITNGDFFQDIRLYTNTGDGYFSFSQIIDLIDSCYSISSIDYDQDGDLDVYTTIPQLGQVVWYENIDGVMGEKNIIEEVDDVGAARVHSDDLNNDGKADPMWSAPLSIYLSQDILGNNEFEHTTKLSVYPNPSRGSFNIESDLNGTANIFNSLGQKVYGGLPVASGHNNYTVNLSPDIYFLQVITNNKKSYMKLIIE